MTNFVAFYSWQSDLPDKTNKNAIRACIRSALSRVEQEMNNQAQIKLDEATRDTSGSPNIPATILSKIDACDLLIADVSTVSEEGAPRKTPNPNVVFELGYATAQHGWSRIIMLFNKAHGKFPTDLPFDFDRHRVSDFKILPVVTGKPAKEELESLTNLLAVAIKAILEANPKRPWELRGLSPEQEKRVRDISNIKWALSKIHIPTLDEHIDRAPKYIKPKVLSFWSGFDGVIANSLFHLYDVELNREMRKLHAAWGETLSYGQYYVDNPAGNLLIFQLRGDVFNSEEQESAWQKIDEARLELRDSLAEVLKIVREKYIEIDIAETNDAAWREWIRATKDNE